MASQDCPDQHIRSDQEIFDRLWAAAYQSARELGCDDAAARQAAKLAQEQLAVETPILEAQLSLAERAEQAQQRPALSLERQLELWRMRGRGWENPSQDLARAEAMYAAGATPDDVVDAQFPFRRDLITRGRPWPRDQVAYAEQLAALSNTIDKVVTAQVGGTLPAAPDPAFARGVSPDQVERQAVIATADVSDAARSEQGQPPSLSDAPPLDDSDVAPPGCREYPGCPALRHRHMTHAEWWDKVMKARRVYRDTGKLSRAAQSVKVSIPTIRKWFLWEIALTEYRLRG